LSAPDLGGDPIDPNVPPGHWGPSYQPDSYRPPDIASSYDYWPTEPRRPGEVLTAAILSLVDAGLLLVVGFVVILASSTFDDTGDTFNATDRAGVYVGAGLANIVVAVALIVGAVRLLSQGRSGRPTIVIATLLCVTLGIFWITEVDGIAIWLVVFCGPAVVAAALTGTPRVSNWLKNAA
jgi:hypothetical protein